MTQQSSRLDVIIDSRQAERNGQQLRITLNNLVVVGDQTAQSMNRAGTAARSAGAAFAALGAGAAAREIVKLTDAFKSMQGGLNLVSASTEDAQKSFQKLLEMANNTGSSLQSTVSLYTRLANATKGAGFSQEQLLGVTDAINKAFVISGATMQEASNAAIQLSQGLASGALRGEELNSVMEQGPRITRVLSEYLGVTNGQIRAMAAEGKITSEVITNALLASTGKLNAELARMPRLFEQASTALKNNFLANIGQINIDPLISSVDAMAAALQDPKVVAGIQSLASGLGSIAAAGGGALKAAISNVDALMAITAAYATKVGVGLVTSLAASVKARYADAAATNQQAIAARQAELAAASETVAIHSVTVASTEAALARALYARSEAMAASQSEINSIRSLKAVAAQLAADRNLEIQRQKAQINNIGLAASHTRLAEIRTAEAAITTQLSAAEARLAASRATELATGAVVGQQTVALNAARLEGAAALAAQTAAQNALNTAETRGTAVRAASFAAVGGPLGLITLGLAAAAAGYVYFSSSADQATQSLIDQNLSLDDTVKKFDELTAAQQRNQLTKWSDAQAAAMKEARSAATSYANIAVNAISSVGQARADDIQTLNSMIARVKAGRGTLEDVTVWLKSTQSGFTTFSSDLEEIAAGYDGSIKSASDYAARIASVDSASKGAASATNTLTNATAAGSRQQEVGAAAWDKYIDTLTKARDLVGANAAAEAEYTARKMGANAAQVAQAKAIAEQTDLLGKYQDAVKENNKAEQDRLKILLLASYSAQVAAEQSAAAQQKALAETATAAENSAKRQVTALQRIAQASYAGVMANPNQQNLSGYGLLTNGKSPSAQQSQPAAIKSAEQRLQDILDQINTGTTPNKPKKGPKGPNENAGLASAMSAFDQLYKKADPAAQAVRDLTEAQEKLQLALSKGKITQEQYGVALGQASRDYAAAIAKTNEMSAAEQYRMQMLRQLQNAQSEADQRAAAVGMGSQAASRAQERINLEKATNDKILSLQTELANANGDKQREALQKQIDITNEMLPQQISVLEGGWAQIDAAQSNWMNGLSAGWDNYQAKVADVAGQTATIMTSSLDTITTGFGGAFSAMALDGQTFGEVALGTFQNLTRGVLDGLGQIAAQWLVNQAIELAVGQTDAALSAARIAQSATETTTKVAGITTVTTAKVAADGIATASALGSIAKTLIANVSAAATTIASWAPAALVASIGSFGAAAVVGGAALIAAFALIKGIGGFSAGGYTGAGGVNDPAGIVHRGEVVWSQADIKRWGGVQSVEAMRTGEAMPAGMGRGSSAPTTPASSSEASSSTSRSGLTVQLFEDASKAGKVEQLTTEDVVRIYVSNIQAEGDIHSANQGKYGLQSVGI